MQFEYKKKPKVIKVVKEVETPLSVQDYVDEKNRDLQELKEDAKHYKWLQHYQLSFDEKVADIESDIKKVLQKKALPKIERNVETPTEKISSLKYWMIAHKDYLHECVILKNSRNNPTNIATLSLAKDILRGAGIADIVLIADATENPRLFDWYFFTKQPITNELKVLLKLSL